MKAVKVIVAFILLVSMLCGCNINDDVQNAVNVKTPDIEQIRSICQVTTLECRYNNVAKSVKKAGTGWSHWLEKDRKFWIEYQGFAKLGIDYNKVGMEVNENTVTIIIPPAELQDIGIVTETFNENSYKTSQDSWWNKNKISTEEQQEAVNKAQETMKETILANESLFVKAQEEAKKLIEKYIQKFGEISEVEYTIVWEYI